MSNLEAGPCSELEYKAGERNRLMRSDLTRGMEVNPAAIYTWVVMFRQGGAYKQPVKPWGIWEYDEEAGLYIVDLELLDEFGESDADEDSSGIYKNGFYIEEEKDDDLDEREVITLPSGKSEEGVVDTGYIRLPRGNEGLEGDVSGIDIEGGLETLRDFANTNPVKP